MVSGTHGIADYSFEQLKFEILNDFERYPSYCIRSYNPVIFHRCDRDVIMSSFLKDLVTRMPSVCGATLRFSKTALFPEVCRKS